MIKYLLFLALTLLTTLLFLGCGPSSEDLIDSANQNAQNSQSKQKEFGEINPLALQDGDCFNGPSVDYSETVTEYFNVNVVPCSGQWMYKVINSFLVDKDGPYPGEDYFRLQFNTHCDPRATLFLFPLPESWELGDRSINCLQEQS